MSSRLRDDSTMDESTTVVDNDDESVEYEYDDDDDAEESKNQSNLGGRTILVVDRNSEPRQEAMEIESDEEWSRVSESNAAEGMGVGVVETPKESNYIPLNRQNHPSLPAAAPAAGASSNNESASTSSSWSVITKLKTLTAASINSSTDNETGKSSSSVAISELTNEASTFLVVVPSTTTQKLHEPRDPSVGGRTDNKSTTSSWSILPRMKGLKTHKGESSASGEHIKRNQPPVAANDDVSYTNHLENGSHKRFKMDDASLISFDGTNGTRRSNLATTLKHVSFQPSGMVRCLMCTMDNLPGAQVCQACALPITANPTTDIDHEIALRLARIEEGDGIQDMQSLLLEGKICPSSMVTDEVPAYIRVAHSCADKLLVELQTMAASLRSDKTCNVVTTIQKIDLVRYLVYDRSHLMMHDVPDYISFGFFVTSRPCESVVADGVIEEDVDKATVLCASSSVFHPWQQVDRGHDDKDAEIGNVSKYVWLVLLGPDSTYEKGDTYARTRVMETQYTKAVKGKQYTVTKGDPAIPLLCTANSNFAIPYRAKSTPQTCLALVQAYTASLDQLRRGAVEALR